MPRTMRRSYGGLSAEQRQAVRRARLLDAGLELLGTAGWTATTMTAVCREAGLTERYFYESFADRDALAEAVFDRLAVGAREAILVAVAVGGDAPRARAEAAIGGLVRYLVEDPRRLRIACRETVASGVLKERRHERLRGLAALLATLGRDVYGEHLPDPEAVELLALMLAGGLSEALLAWADARTAITPAQVTARAADFFLAAAALISDPIDARRGPPRG